jgi:putative hemolysin
VHAGNAARLEQSYRDIADQVRLSGRTNSQANVFELMRDWLRDEKHGKWLLVLDNADDAAVLASLPGHDQQHLSRYLPPSKYGTVVVTSRSGHAASRLVEERDTLHIRPMHDTSAQALLRKKLGPDVDTDGVGELAAALDYMPLALVQAAAYIQKRAPHYSVQQYLEEFRRSDKRKATLLDQEAGHLRRDDQAKNSIIITWQISFEHIRSTRRSAADLLSLMSFFDRQGIPKTLLRFQYITQTAHEGTRAGDIEEIDSDEEDATLKSIIDDAFIGDILVLRDYSFVSETIDPKTLEMHSLVQLATQRWLEVKGEVEGWKQQFISTLCMVFPPGLYENWEWCQVLFPHAIAALGKRPRSNESCKDWALLLHNAAWYACERGSVDEAETLARTSMEVRSNLLGVESDETLRSMALVGWALSRGGRWEAAEQLDVQVMETRKTKLGTDHPDTLNSMNNLASTYWYQGRLEAAEQLQVQVLETRKTKLGADHPDTLNSMINLASTYCNQERLEAAEQLQMQVMETSRTKLGADHPDTLTSMANLASSYYIQGRWETSEQLSVQVMEIRKTKLGADHPDTLTSMSNLASTYRSQGRWEAAEQLEVQVIEGRKTKLGADHPDTLTSMTNLASSYCIQGRWEASEQLDVQVMETLKTKLGADHPVTLTSMNNLAFTWKGQERNAGAIALMRHCAEISRRELGATHPNTVSSIATLAAWAT